MSEQLALAEVADDVLKDLQADVAVFFCLTNMCRFSDIHKKSPAAAEGCDGTL